MDKNTEKYCPSGHGYMIFYKGEQDDESQGDPDFYECPECGYREEVNNGTESS